MAIGSQRVTLAEFLALPEEEPALEYFDGDVTQKMSPKTWHGVLQADWASQLRVFTRGRRLAHVMTEHRSTYGGMSTVPDIAVYRWGRIPRDASGRLVNDVTIPPDIAIEILSPGQSLRSLSERCRWYVENGVSISLLTNPTDSTIRDFRPGAEPRILQPGDRLDPSEMLPGFVLDVTSLFDVLTGD